MDTLDQEALEQALVLFRKTNRQAFVAVIRSAHEDHKQEPWMVRLAAAIKKHLKAISYPAIGAELGGGPDLIRDLKVAGLLAWMLDHLEAVEAPEMLRPMPEWFRKLRDVRFER